MNPTQANAEREPIKLRPFVGALLADFEILARARHLTLDALVFLEEINGDASLLRRLLTDLVGEALRRAPAGTTVSVVVSPREGQAEFRIADEGAGMTAEALDRAFDADAAHGGRLSVTETDDGTVVCLAFPSNVGNAAAIQLNVDGKAARGVAKAKPAVARSASGIYARACELADTTSSGAVSRPARASGRDT
jgi:K+-sensing histidine kinase KdpD